MKSKNVITPTASCLRENRANNFPLKGEYREMARRRGNCDAMGERPASKPAGALSPACLPPHGTTVPHGGPLPPTEEKKVISFFHAFTPPRATAQQRRHLHDGRNFLPQRARLAFATLQAVMEAHRPPKPLEGPLHVLLGWTWPGKEIRHKTTRPDLDNLAKLALDAATRAGYWHDDAQIAMLTLAKYLGPIPGLAMSVAVMEEP
jgi:Holliday junction resolvase RusA-like endonuclease